MPKVDQKTFLILWLFNPFISAIYLFRNFKQNSQIGPYLLLSLFFGISFVVSTEGADSQRYAAELLQYYDTNMSFAAVQASFYSEESTKLDIYQPLVTWLVSCFTSNVKFLFAIFAIVFGYFWFKSLILIREYITVPLTGLVFAVFISLALINPIWNINGVRMWTAIMIFFYGLLLLNLNKDKKGWYFLILPLLVHFSLIIALILYVVYQFVPLKNKTIFFGIFIATFFLGELDLEVLRDYFAQLPGFAQSKQAYLNEEYAETVNETKENLAIHVFLAGKLIKYILFTIVVVMFFYSKKTLKDKKFELFFIMGLLFASFSNLAASVPSGGRFGVLSNLILYTAFLLFLNNKTQKLPAMKNALIVALFLVALFKVRMGLDFIGMFLFIGNPIINYFIYDTPLIDSIKNLF